MIRSYIIKISVCFLCFVSAVIAENSTSNSVKKYVLTCDEARKLATYWKNECKNIPQDVTSCHTEKCKHHVPICNSNGEYLQDRRKGLIKPSLRCN